MASISEELLSILVCPETKQRVKLADSQVVIEFNARISRREITNMAGSPVEEPVEALLVREDGNMAYPIRMGIPIMLVEEALRLR